MWSDFRYALRSLLKTPGFTAVAVLTLALGIGMNTAVFSLLNAALLRSLPVPDPQQLRVVNWSGNFNYLTQPLSVMGPFTGSMTGEQKRGAFAAPAYEFFRDRAQGFSSIFAFNPLNGATVFARGAAYTSDGLLVTGNFFEGYGAKPLLGRAVLPEDDRPGAPPVAVISYRLWEREFGSDPAALGQTIAINGVACAIVGILPREFADPLLGDPFGFYIPVSLQNHVLHGTLLGSLSPRQMWSMQVMARLAPGADERQARASLNVLFSQILPELGQTRAVGHMKILLEDGSQGPMSTTAILEQIAKPVFVLMAAVALLLLIACANLASLLLARAASREDELALRAAIGASRWRLLRLPLTESVLLSAVGGALGLLLAAWTCSAVSKNFFSQWLTGDAQLEAALDLRVLGFVSGVSLLTAVVFGILPALRATRADPLKGLKSGRSRGGGPRLKLGGVLVVVQVSLSVVLLFGAGLMARTFANLSHARTGFDAGNLVLFGLRPTQAGYTGGKLLEFYDSVRHSLLLLPGVRSVSVSLNGPMLGALDANIGFGIPCNENGGMLFVGDSFLSAMGIPLMRGREFSDSDTAASPRVAIVNKTFVERCLQGREAIGHTFQIFDGAPYRVVGVSGDSRYGNIKQGMQPLVFIPARQQPMSLALGMTMLVRSTLPPASMEPAIRKAVAAIDPRVPVTKVATQQGLIDRSIDQERLLATFGAFTGVLAALLAGIGLFGLLAYTVSRRTSEIGVRMALGAQQTEVVRLIAVQGMGLVAVGLCVGTVAALWVARLLQSFLWGVETTDRLTLAGTAVLLAVIALVACIIPARRAAKVDPLIALRAE